MITREFFKWVVSFIMGTIIAVLIVAGFYQPIIWVIIMVAVLTSLIRFCAFK